jgi:hypothetical protein
MPETRQHFFYFFTIFFSPRLPSQSCQFLPEARKRIVRMAQQKTTTDREASFSAIVGRLCQTPSLVALVGVSQKRPTNLAACAPQKSARA